MSQHSLQKETYGVAQQVARHQPDTQALWLRRTLPGRKTPHGLF